MGCVRETPQIKKRNKSKTKNNNKNMGCVRETPHIKTKSAWDV